MALISCPECGKEVSDRAPACIHCGYPLSSAAPYADFRPITGPNRFTVRLTARPAYPDARSRALRALMKELGLIPAGSTVVSIVTGNGLKDVQSGIQAAGEPMRVSPDMDALLAAFAAQDIRP